MAFETQNAVEESLLRARNDPAARPDFYRALLAAELFVIGRAEGADGGTSKGLNPGDRVMIMHIPYNDRSYIPVFSSFDRLRQWVREEVGYLAMPGRSLFENTPGAYFLLNPDTQVAKELLPDEIQSLLAPSLQEYTIDRPTEVRIGQPAVFPKDLVAALKAMFRSRPDVLSAHLAQIAFARDGSDAHLLIGIEATGDWPPLSAEVARVLSEAAPGTVLDIMPLSRDPADAFSAELLRMTPFYKRAPGAS
jgi:hypothetical protein